MNADIELSLAALLTASLTALQPVPVIRAATAKETIPTGRQLIAAKIDDCPHHVGPLYYAVGAITIKTPIVDGLTAVHHSAAVRASQDSLIAPTDAFEAALQSHRLHYTGSFITGTKDAHDDTHWISRVAFKLGIELVTN